MKTVLNIIERQDIDRLFEALNKVGYSTAGPTVRDELIVYDHISSSQDLPVGWTDEQEAGRYRLKKRNDKALFGYIPGADSWKKFLFPSKKKLWEAKRNDQVMQIIPEKPSVKKLAFIGVRSCELQAISIQDKVFIGGLYKDTHYQVRRKNILIVAVNCTEPGKTCFCHSMETGPEVKEGYDLCLTEIINPQEHYFLVQVGSHQGKEVLKAIPHQEAYPTHQVKLDACMKEAHKKMGREMDTKYIKELLNNHYEHPQWDKVAERCLSCANCTMVCPTCFCSTVEDVTDLTGDHAERWQKWDSCFTQDFSYIHGGHIRKSTKSCYRQWMTHKLASWQDQFGTSGCVGCGRCITWCPAGIDITEEVKHIRDNPKGGSQQ